MEYITVREAAEMWKISVRRVQYLCAHNMLPGSVRFGKVWSIPADCDKPRDNRRKVNTDGQNDISGSFGHVGCNGEMLYKIIEFFPYPIQVYKPDGMMVLTNDAALRLMHISSKDQLIGKFNVLKDPVIDKWGEEVRKRISGSFQGETVQFRDLKIPIRGILDRFGVEELCLDSSFQNITCFPIFDDNNKLEYVVHVFVTTKLYNGKEEMVRAKEYIERHWLEEFNLDKAAGSVNLSRYHFSRLFKKFTSMTPFSYYQYIKICKLKEKLCDINLSVSDAFSACGLDYNGSYARVFRKKVGMTPSQYRKVCK
ncbi:MAG TPA: helix-turn-helix domain-containing protein [Clostridia bacterium]|nr:helix-turn-helix domain-containing protein [Clostridia bacterium]